MCPPPFLITASRRRRHSLILLSMKRCEFLPLGDYRSLQFFHRLELSLVVDSLLKSNPNSVIHGINIRDIWRPHVRFNEVDVLFVHIVHRGPGGVRWRSILLQCSPVMATLLLWCQVADTSRGRHCSSMNCYLSLQDRCLPRTRYSDPHHDVATEV